MQKKQKRPIHNFLLTVAHLMAPHNNPKPKKKKQCNNTLYVIHPYGTIKMKEK